MRKFLTHIPVISLSVLVILLFLSLNSDASTRSGVQSIVGAFVFTAWFLSRYFLKQHKPSASRTQERGLPLSIIFFALFILFVLMRFIWAGVALYVLKIPASYDFPAHRYFTVPGEWLFFFAIFFVSWASSNRKQAAYLLLLVSAWCAFLLSINIMPVLSQHVGLPYYYARNGQAVFFHPWLYTIHPWISRYVIGVWSHVNYIGDVIAMGLFPALGLAVYSFRLFREKARGLGHDPAVKFERLVSTISSAFLYLIMACTSSTVIFLLLARGTILCFSVMLIFYFCGYILKVLKGRSVVFSIMILVAVFVFLTWAGQLPKAVNELTTLQSEKFEKRGGSASMNWEGAQRALRIYEAFPIWGAGIGGYKVLSEDFETPGAEEEHGYVLAKFQSMCHYLHLLAEEGIGAYLYFLFILGYLIDLLIGLVRVRGRFQFIAALSFATPALLVLMHAAINHLMQRFSLPVLVYIFMGTSLAVLRKDYER